MDPGQELEKITVPSAGNWPGAMASFKLVRPNIKARIWNFISVFGLAIIASLFLDIIIAAIFKHATSGVLVNYLFGLVIAGFLQAATITMYFSYLNNKELSVNEAMSYAYSRVFKMAGLLVVMYVMLLVSFILLIIPFFFILPRIYLAPYFLICDDLKVSQAIAASWHLSKGHFSEIWGILGLSVAIALLFLTIIGIPFAIYWGIVNSGSYALFTLYLSQPKKKPKI